MMKTIFLKMIKTASACCEKSFYIYLNLNILPYVVSIDFWQYKVEVEVLNHSQHDVK